MAHSDLPELPLSFLLALLDEDTEPASSEVAVKTRSCLEPAPQPLRSLWGAPLREAPEALSL